MVKAMDPRPVTPEPVTPGPGTLQLLQLLQVSKVSTLPTPVSQPPAQTLSLWPLLQPQPVPQQEPRAPRIPVRTAGSVSPQTPCRPA